MDSATQSTIKRIQDTFFELEAFTKDFHDLKESCLSFANEVSKPFMKIQSTRLWKELNPYAYDCHIREFVTGLRSIWP